MEVNVLCGKEFKKEGDIMASIFKQQYTTKDKNGKKVKRKSSYWYIDYKSSDGTRKRLKAYKDKQADMERSLSSQ